jgi:hypothetical protein
MSGAERLKQVTDSVTKAIRAGIPTDAQEVEIKIDWKEMGEFAGDIIYPIVEVKYKL